MGLEKDRRFGHTRYVEPGELSARERGRDLYVRAPRRAIRAPIMTRDLSGGASGAGVAVDPRTRHRELPAQPPLAPAPVVLPPGAD